jgi:hypothetical protein
MKQEIQSNLLKQIISMAQKAMVNEPLEEQEEGCGEEGKCPACGSKLPQGCDECMEDVEEEEPEFKNSNIKFVKVQVKKPKSLKKMVNEMMGE